MKYTGVILTTLVLLILALSPAGCDAIEDVFEDENEVRCVIESIGDGALRVDGIEYTVTDGTEYEDVDGFDTEVRILKAVSIGTAEMRFREIERI